MLDILDEKHEILDKTDKIIEVHSGKIEFKNVNFAYNE
jgi:ABC-type multidrug transport system fused ATPase/permease subunit